MLYTIKCKWKQDSILITFLPGEGNSLLLMEYLDATVITIKGRLRSNLINLLFGKAFTNSLNETGAAQKTINIKLNTSSSELNRYILMPLPYKTKNYVNTCIHIVKR